MRRCDAGFSIHEPVKREAKYTMHSQDKGKSASKIGFLSVQHLPTAFSTGRSGDAQSLSTTFTFVASAP
jgi:hypothetical protein